MKKNVYISPIVEVEDMETCSELLEASPTGTNVTGLGIADEDAPSDMVGRSRQSIWDDEDEEEKW